MGLPVKALTLSDAERSELESQLRRLLMPPAEKQRARMILLSTEGLRASKIGERVGASVERVGEWRKRFDQSRIVGLTDAPRSRRDDKVTESTRRTRSFRGGSTA